MTFISINIRIYRSKIYDIYLGFGLGKYNISWKVILWFPLCRPLLALAINIINFTSETCETKCQVLIYIGLWVCCIVDKGKLKKCKSKCGQYYAWQNNVLDTVMCWTHCILNILSGLSISSIAFQICKISKFRTFLEIYVNYYFHDEATK
jgi:hypothetical protein